MANNHANYQGRLDYIRQLLAEHLGVSSENAEHTEITPIEYDPNWPFKYNNFVYRILLPIDTVVGHRNGRDTDETGIRKQPGCVPIPAGTREFILRLSNPEATDMHPETRVQNEVGLITLASAALSGIKPAVVPRVFGWGSASGERLGWILQELMPGVPLLEPYENMSLDQKKGILAQMATLLKALQNYRLPDSITGWGGVTFDDSGAIVSAPMTNVGAGPWTSFEDSYRARLQIALSAADENPHLRGWQDNGIRDRVNAFIQDGLSAQFAHLASKQARTIVHADFTPDNLLYDPATGRVTALLDYDFACILHPAYEFFHSFRNSGGEFTGWKGDTTPLEKEALELRRAKLTGWFISPLPTPVASENGPAVDWEVAQAWEGELQTQQVNRPSEIEGIEQIADVDAVLNCLSPWRLTNGDFLRMNPGEDQRAALRRMAERELTVLLDHVGF
ncbi:kinase-like domain-containing protein [Nemania abortiva]|nr:kinase-like domain-containing protein [Nemania abortiva]